MSIPVGSRVVYVAGKDQGPPRAGVVMGERAGRLVLRLESPPESANARGYKSRRHHGVSAIKDRLVYPESLRRNGGVLCDQISGPCACKAWHLE